MPFLAFLFQTILISFSGVMAPGPITATTIGQGSRSPHAGAKIAIGHGIIEFPLMITMLFGFSYLAKMPYIKSVIAFSGGVFLVYMGIDMIRSAIRMEPPADMVYRAPVFAGIVLSAVNPYFILWWATIGFTLISQSVQFGLAGFIALAVVHWTCDFIWLYFLSAISFSGGKFLGRKFQGIAFAVCGVCLIVFGGIFFVDGLRMI